MPFMDGYEATEKIREFLFDLGLPQPIIIAVTGHSEPEYVARAIKCGMNQVFSKPLNSKLLKSVAIKMELISK